MATVLDEFYGHLKKSVRPDRTAKVEWKMQKPKHPGTALLFWIVLLVGVSFLVLRPDPEITLDDYQEQYAATYGATGLSFREVINPNDEDLAGLTRMGYVQKKDSKVKVLLLQFTSPKQAEDAMKNYGADLQVKTKDNLMVVINTKDQSEAKRYLDTLDHTR